MTPPYVVEVEDGLIEGTTTPRHRAVRVHNDPRNADKDQAFCGYDYTRVREVSEEEAERIRKTTNLTTRLPEFPSRFTGNR